ncbi:PrgI family protein [Candidatus Parcubacteria bacterium]|nr:MAG: PrgI family protein [Candidatus Parcubacteria bacterium]
MRYEVPQFSEVETKIVGFLSFKQLIYLGVGGGMVYILYKTAPNPFVFIAIAGPIAALAIALAFVKVNGRPFLNFLGSLSQFLLRPKFYIWKKELPKMKQVKYEEEEEK